MPLRPIPWRAAIIILAIGSCIGACSSNDPAAPPVTDSSRASGNEQAAALASPVDESPAAAIAAIEALGGSVQRDDSQPGSPVVAINLVGLDNLKDEDLRLLRPFATLRELYLGHTATSDAGLKHLAGLKNLTDLGLIGTRVTDIGLKELLGLQNLENLRLGNAPISDSGLKYLAKLKNLKTVMLRSSAVTDAGLKELAKALPNLVIFGGGGGVRGVGVAGTGQQSTGQRTDPNFDVSVARPAYTEQHPSVFFDEAHQNFHTASGRYKVFADLITNDGYRVTPNKDALTPERLAGHSVLIIANSMTDSETITSAFTEAECDAVQKWVEGGGSLLLITDHEPFGSASDELGRRFGVEMSLRVTFDPANESDRGLLFARDKNQLGNHPIMQGREKSEQVSRVLTFTGQSLKGPPGSVGLLQFADTAKEREGRDKEISAAGRSQGVALKYGRGRVVVMGEAAQLSAQVFGSDPPIPMGMNVPGCDNRQMALNVIHWLSGLLD